ncbi:hypothetical protein T05_7095 [Trichinella murrelli]|uniref:Uncharacterized protein n=1 Tax=Trichinella murrelli TaxID=144512 RepID=A0A0V0STY0_9BILA|nr:hypothetical protein T05_7095 [Trichinella murrelli]
MKKGISFRRIKEADISGRTLLQEEKFMNKDKKANSMKNCS